MEAMEAYGGLSTYRKYVLPAAYIYNIYIVESFWTLD